jgi:hypothetical protein
VQPGQQRAGLGALLVDQPAAGLPVQAQRIGRPAGPVQRSHLVRGEGLVQRVLGEQLMQLADQVGVPAELHLALDPVQDGRAALLLQAVAHPGHPVAAHPGQRLAAPQPVRLAQQPGGVLVIAAAGQRVGLPPEPAELMQVHGLGVDVELVAAGPPDQLHVLANRLAQRAPEPGDVDRQALPGLGRRVAVPQPVDEHVGRHDHARRQQEDGQYPARPGRAKIMWLPVRPELNRPECPEFHDRLASSTTRGRGHR